MAIEIKQIGEKIVGENVSAKIIADKKINALSEEIIQNGEIDFLLCVIAYGREKENFNLKSEKEIQDVANRLEASDKFNCLRLMYKPQEIIMILELVDECLISRKAKGTNEIEKLKQIASLNEYCRDLMKGLNFEVYVQPIYYKSVYNGIMNQIE